MIELKGVAHFAIPVSDVDNSTKFYTEVVGCKFLSQLPNQKITFLDAGGGVCLLLIKRPAPIHKAPTEMSDGVHHAFMVEAEAYEAAKGSLRAKGVDIFFEEGVAPEKIHIAHCGDSPDVEYIEGLLDRGVYVGLDRYGLDCLQPGREWPVNASAGAQHGHDAHCATSHL